MLTAEFISNHGQEATRGKDGIVINFSTDNLLSTSGRMWVTLARNDGNVSSGNGCLRALGLSTTRRHTYANTSRQRKHSESNTRKKSFPSTEIEVKTESTEDIV